jgi:hypothetical protein
MTMTPQTLPPPSSMTILRSRWMMMLLVATNPQTVSYLIVPPPRHCRMCIIIFLDIDCGMHRLRQPFSPPSMSKWISIRKL